MDASFDKEIEEMELEAESDKGVSGQGEEDEFDDLLEGGEEEEVKRKRLPQIDFVDFEDDDIEIPSEPEELTYANSNSRYYNSVTSKTLTKLESEGNNLL